MSFWPGNIYDVAQYPLRSLRRRNPIGDPHRHLETSGLEQFDIFLWNSAFGTPIKSKLTTQCAMGHYVWGLINGRIVT